MWWWHWGVKSSHFGPRQWSQAWGRRWGPWCGGKWCWTRHSSRPCSETWTSHGRRCLVSGPPDYKYCSWLKQETMYTKEKLAGFSWLSEMLFQFVPILKFLMKSALFQVLFISLISTWNPSILRNISAWGSWDKVEYREWWRLIYETGAETQVGLLKLNDTGKVCEFKIFLLWFHGTWIKRSNPSG